MKCACMDCKDRQVGCHSYCRKYKDYVAYNEKIIQAKAMESLLKYKRRG